MTYLSILADPSWSGCFPSSASFGLIYIYILWVSIPNFAYFKKLLTTDRSSVCLYTKQKIIPIILPIKSVTKKFYSDSSWSSVAKWSRTPWITWPLLPDSLKSLQEYPPRQWFGQLLSLWACSWPSTARKYVSVTLTTFYAALMPNSCPNQRTTSRFAPKTIHSWISAWRIV